ncbi:methylated-DNA--[protein]-cysteine S-methyltransferase [Ignatzschineria rhizosphaerae]|uniref:Methylated-DNA--[protein]-cysteine S-methyltransferase n=1 Tax=Ignatzschineria rhizosphaerae TaxID=2923279 RepID=A0ABY3X2S8_9GAMM|nr:methylated-DNA--[protein]-cysteine S-methyltransferase [Ignatzschineria rhizosphaerae]UNM97154.1 methylated-DNA--[protein]-cysteine S-methyltransferase [Ignatzschineria rhizosphaerae]
MRDQQNYARIAKAIEYIQDNFKAQPSLSEVASHVHLSPAHFQRLFTNWAGVSPKKFLQYISLEYAKSLLKSDKSHDIFDATFATGLSSTSRLHDLFVSIEGMTPSEFRQGGQNLTIYYQFVETLFGALLIASTDKGICHMAFITEKVPALEYLKQQFPKATYKEQVTQMQSQALQIFDPENKNLSKIKLHLKGTDFQLKVWESLLKIPSGSLTTYHSIAKEIGNEKASRAVGSAIGKNPIAFIIPCHRVIQTSGHLGGYMWGLTRKNAIIGWEGAQKEIQTKNHETIMPEKIIRQSFKEKC